MVIPVQVGTIARTHFETLDSQNGSRTSPDAPPIVLTVHVDGVLNSTLTESAAVQPLQDETPTNITGFYELEVNTTNLTLNQDLYVTVRALINGFYAFKVFHFVITANDNAVPVIR